ncbi:MAG TPA: ABC transporter permease [Patescibacteria group bacterium]|nr:ABC transporter permease [Patescibacteria group bacterium]
MFLSDLVEETYMALVANKARSALTILGIVIGIASVIAMVAIGQGAKGNVEASVESIGSNLILIMPGAARGIGFQASAGRGSAQTLTQADADAIAAANVAKAVAPDLTRRYQVTAPGTNTNTSVIGTVSSYPEVRNVAIDQGSFITDQDVEGVNRVAVLGPTTRDDLFGTGADAIGQTIRINKVNFRVVGVTQSKGGSGFNNADDVIYIPISAAQRYLAGDAYVSTISIEAPSQAAMSDVQQQVTSLLLARHQISNPANADFSVLNQSDLVATASSVTNTFTVLLAAIAGISLLVGGIGIMNMMLTTVTERTREIGLRKAIGAQRQDITYQFLMEAVALTFSGGAFGILLGWLLSFVVTHFTSLPSAISLSSVLLAFGVSVAIGIAFGYYPALRASRLNPIDALRHE